MYVKFASFFGRYTSVSMGCAVDAYLENRFLRTGCDGGLVPLLHETINRNDLTESRRVSVRGRCCQCSIKNVL